LGYAVIALILFFWPGSNSRHWNILESISLWANIKEERNLFQKIIMRW
jgi:hypothetical protein